MTGAKKLLHEKVIDIYENIMELIVWQVPITTGYPDGVKYRFVYVNAREDKVLVLYDNHYPKGHHRHLKGQQEYYNYVNIRQVIKDFKRDVAEVIKHENT